MPIEIATLWQFMSVLCLKVDTLIAGICCRVNSQFVPIYHIRSLSPYIAHPHSLQCAPILRCLSLVSRFLWLYRYGRRGYRCQFRSLQVFLLFNNAFHRANSKARTVKVRNRKKNLELVLSTATFRARAASATLSLVQRPCKRRSTHFSILGTPCTYQVVNPSVRP